MTRDEYRDRLLLAILQDDRAQAASVPYPQLDVMEAGRAAGLPAEPPRVSQAVQSLIDEGWVKNPSREGGRNYVQLTDEGRKQESRIRSCWTISLSFPGAEALGG